MENENTTAGYALVLMSVYDDLHTETVTVRVIEHYEPVTGILELVTEDQNGNRVRITLNFEDGA